MHATVRHIHDPATVTLSFQQGQAGATLTIASGQLTKYGPPKLLVTAADAGATLKRLDDLFQKKLITKVEYDRKRAEILKDM